ncbi:MAG: Pyrophosphatase PpaX [Candidatus Collierbacteria bacterium GW2011_GWF2_44_15]|uniref:Pyrophosphatase PpaX n=2 Tax=Candidatus Collieribacteriota TaxID=1752725 RepID=A0A0G1HE34_9BACT|nr:MAG: Pyrophosphatase PpaX [Candidatus Collierbacteria bacterium GW2011_GWA1_44_12]KKT45611.1 MAG: Pyrophosphatase PpaX [Candidatus Collierbacteria bacterium GW2011_GWF2_44_15]
MKYKYFLFDWDGSLGNSLPMWFEAFQKVFAEYGKRVTYKQIGEKVIGDWEGPSRMGIENQEEFFTRMEVELMPKLPFVELNPGAKELIENIKKLGGKVAVVSSSKRKYVEPAMQKNGLMNLVDVFLAKEDVKRHKPDPMMLNRAIGMVGGEPDKALMVGDTGKDIMAAKNAGMASALYYPKRYEEFYARRLQEGWKSTYTIRSFGELSRFLK